MKNTKIALKNYCSSTKNRFYCRIKLPRNISTSTLSENIVKDFTGIIEEGYVRGIDESIIILSGDYRSLDNA